MADTSETPKERLTLCEELRAMTRQEIYLGVIFLLLVIGVIVWAAVTEDPAAVAGMIAHSEFCVVARKGAGLRTVYTMKDMEENQAKLDAWNSMLSQAHLELEEVRNIWNLPHHELESDERHCWSEL